MVRSLVMWVFVLHASFLFASVQQAAPDTVLPGSIGRELPGIVIKRKPMLGKFAGDTVSFHAGRFLTPGAFRLEDLVKNIPGFRVDDNGRIYFNGKEINRIMIDGDDVAGERYQLLSRNLKALMVDSLQVIHRFEKNRLLRSFGNQDAIAVNLIIKKSFLGKLSGTVSVAKDPEKYGEADGELIRLVQSSKQLLFVNSNNVGGKGVADRGNETPSSSRNGYRAWPFGKSFATNPFDLPFAYVNRNSDQSLAFVSSFAVKKHSKLKISSTAVHHENNNMFSNRFDYNIPGERGLSIQTTANELNAIHGGSLCIDVETDKGRNSVSSFHIRMNPERHQTLQIGTRAGLAYATSKQLEFRSNFNWLAVHQASWKTSASSLLQLENKIVVDRNNDKLNAFFSLDSLTPIFIDQLLAHHGKLISTDIGWISTRKRYTMRVGFNGSFQSISSSIGYKPMGRKLVKQYTNIDFIYRVSKKMDATFKAAAGEATVTDNGIRKSSFVFQLNQQWVWRRRPIEKYHIGIEASRKNSAPHQWHAGPVVMGSTIWTGIQEIAFPFTVGGEAGMTAMNLYKGYTVALTVFASMLRNEYGISTHLGIPFDSLHWFIVPVQKSIVINGYGEQFIHPWKIKFTINANWRMSSMPQQLNGNIFNSTARNTGVDQRAVTNWKGIFNAELHVGLYSSIFLDEHATALPLRSHQYGVKTSLRFSPKLFTQLHFAVQNSGHRQSFVQFDGMIKIAISPQWRSSVVLGNLLNRRHYQQNSISSYGNNQLVQQLNGRRILFGINWGF